MMPRKLHEWIVIEAWIVGVLCLALLGVLAACGAGPPAQAQGAVMPIDDARPAGCCCCCVCPTCPTTEPKPSAAPTTETPAPSPTPAATATPVTSTILWDGRLDKYGVYLKLDPALKFWPTHVFLTLDGNWDSVPAWAQEFNVDTFPERGGATHMFGRALDVGGSVIPTKMFRLWWPDKDPPDGQQGGTPQASGWVNFFVNGRYDWTKTPGPYCVETLDGVPVCGGGQPYGEPHVSIFVVYRARW